jgi:glycosyltransferase involved in cell wall biosynthesis
VRQRKRLLFVSPRFLFPADSGGKIRTSQILAGMKGGHFEITLVSPATERAALAFAAELNSVSDHFYGWPEQIRGTLFNIARLRHLLSMWPISVRSDQSRVGRQLIARELHRRPDIVVFDFAHSAVLAPETLSVPSIMFAHNIEAEIFRRHTEVARNSIVRAIWRDQLRKMEMYERQVLRRFHVVVAVSHRDRQYLEQQYEIKDVCVIPTGVDLQHFEHLVPVYSNRVVFTGSMDWFANIDAIQYMLNEIWPRVIAQAPTATFTVVGRSPPRSLIRKAGAVGLRVEFTGFVDDIKPYVHSSTVYVIPLRVASGTRIKVFEAMAMGCPVVSTSIGTEGLPLEAGEHYLRADSPADFAASILRLLRDKELRYRLSHQARRYVEANFASTKVAKKFEQICVRIARESSTSMKAVSVPKRSW